MKNVSIQDLKTFYSVATTLSFSASAEELYMSQSNVSKIVNRVEKELGVMLIDRSTHHVELTAAGNMLRDACKNALPILDNVFDELEHLDQVELDVAIGLPYRGRKMMKIFSAIDPAVSFKSVSAETAYDTFTGILNQEYAMWITPSILLSTGFSNHLQFREICSDPIYVVLPDYHALAGQQSVSLKDLTRDRFLCHGWHVRCMYQSLMVGSGIHLDVFDQESIINTRASLFIEIREGIGISLAYKSDLEQLSLKGLSVIPIEEGKDNTVGIAYLNEHILSPAEEKFIAFCVRNWNYEV